MLSEGMDRTTDRAATNCVSLNVATVMLSPLSEYVATMVAGTGDGAAVTEMDGVTVLEMDTLADAVSESKDGEYVRDGDSDLVSEYDVENVGVDDDDGSCWYEGEKDGEGETDSDADLEAVRVGPSLVGAGDALNVSEGERVKLGVADEESEAVYDGDVE